VFSGGSGFNDASSRLSRQPQISVGFVLPVTDDGGSSEEIRTKLGVPVGIGDIRSRLLKVAPEDSLEEKAIKALLQYRLPGGATEARDEWERVLDGSHGLWDGVSKPYMDTARAFLIKFQESVLLRAPRTFDFACGSVGNFFLIGALLNLGSLDASILITGSLLRVRPEIAVIPAVDSASQLTLGAQLQNGDLLIGQTQISHPGLQNPRVVDKENAGMRTLPSPVVRVFYLNQDLQETRPAANPRVLNHLRKSDKIVYAMGSLYSSIVPSLILTGVGEEIAQKDCPKILILNADHDRETHGMNALAFIAAIRNALNRYGTLNFQVSDYVNALVVMEGTTIPIDEDELRKMGIDVIHCHADFKQRKYNVIELVEALVSFKEIKKDLLHPAL
jgi:2-phospho-L-lactate transferase/gluconeogenesis factor (CofD/UPF0052 family)